MGGWEDRNSELPSLLMVLTVSCVVAGVSSFFFFAVTLQWIDTCLLQSEPKRRGTGLDFMNSF